ncbi:MAG: glycosyltransferase family 39 protein [Candidatus Hydrogenedentota bacterium]
MTHQFREAAHQFATACTRRGLHPHFLLFLGFWLVASWFVAIGKANDVDGVGAQYWDWSHRLQFCYVNKPPLLTYIYWLTTGVFGDREWVFELLRLAAVFGTIIMLNRLTWRITAHAGAAGLAGAFFAVHGITPFLLLNDATDHLLALFWLAAMWAFHRAIHGARGGWVLTGLFLGLGLLTKHTMVVLPAAFFFYLLLFGRTHLRTRGPYMALALMLLCNAGVLYWNMQHAWIAISHMQSINRGGPAMNHAQALENLAAYLRGQYYGFQPLYVLAAIVSFLVLLVTHGRKHNSDVAFLLTPFSMLLGTYMFIGLQRTIFPHWTLCAWIVAAAAIAWAARPLLRRAVVPIVLLVMALYYVQIAYTEYQAPGRNVGRYIQQVEQKYAREGDFFFASQHNIIGLLSLYLEEPWDIHILPHLDYHVNQYDFWHDWEGTRGRDALYVGLLRGIDAQGIVFWATNILGMFESGEVLEVAQVRESVYTQEEIAVVRFYNCQSVPPVALLRLVPAITGLAHHFYITYTEAMESGRLYEILDMPR